MLRYLFSTLLALIFLLPVESKPPELTSSEVTAKIQEIMRLHASYKKFDDEIIKRVLKNYLDELDPIKSYLIEPDIDMWLKPTQVTRVLGRLEMSIVSPV